MFHLKLSIKIICLKFQLKMEICKDLLSYISGLLSSLMSYINRLLSDTTRLLSFIKLLSIILKRIVLQIT